MTSSAVWLLTDTLFLLIIGTCSLVVMVRDYPHELILKVPMGLIAFSAFVIAWDRLGGLDRILWHLFFWRFLMDASLATLSLMRVRKPSWRMVALNF